MIRKLTRILSLYLFLLLVPVVAGAEERTIRIIGRSDITVTTPMVKLGDLAEVTSRDARDSEAVIALKNISLGQSPAPGSESTVSASRIIELLKDNQFELDKIGYAIPRIIKIKRASRILTSFEIQNAIEQYISDSGRDLSIRKLEYSNDFHVPTSNIDLSVKSLSNQSQGRTTFLINASSFDNGRREDIRHQIDAQVSEWIKLPVASRPVSKGSMVSGDDVMMARLNLNTIPKDAVRESSGIIGHETQRDIGYGEVFRNNRLSIPPAVAAGSRVTVVYRRGGLEATASGIAMESGTIGEEIRIRNDSSRKVVSGTIIESGLIGVLQ
jgi:flagella basal body P-ring formation protein FlgA